MGKTKADARSGALAVLEQVEEGAYANLAQDQYLEGPGKELSLVDRHLLTELVQGVVKRRLTLDWMIDQLAAHPGRLKSGPRILLRLGLYQLQYMDRIPHRAATYETVQLAKTRYHDGVAALVNGILRNWLRAPDQVRWPEEQNEPVQYYAVKFSHPQWLVERWLTRYGPEGVRTFCEYNNGVPELWLRTNTLRRTPARLAEELTAAGCVVTKGRYAPEGLILKEGPPLRELASFQDGHFLVQDESSMLAAHGLAPLPGQKVLDVCAAPGGKTTHIAQLMEDRGEILAWDIHPHRVQLIRSNAQRLGIISIHAALGDGQISPTPAEAGVYDRILVDAPCSGLGVLRRRADARWRRSPADIAQLTQVQGQILAAALDRLAPGGRLLYSTCTVEPEENRLLVEEVLAAKAECRKGQLPLQALGLAATDDWEIQCLPFTHGLEGFYMAALEKPLSDQR